MRTRTRIRRNARRRESARPYTVVLRALVVIGALGVFAVIALRAPRGVPLLGYKTVYAELPDAGNLRIHSEVRSAGARIGEVVGLDVDDGRARLRMKLDPGADFAKDSEAVVRGKGLLGARFINIVPGRSKQLLASGDTITEGKNPLTLSVNDALQTFDAQTRGGMRDLAGQLGVGVLGRGQDLNDAVRDAPPAARSFLHFTGFLLADPQPLRALVPSVASASTALDESREEVVALLPKAQAALKPLNERRVALRSTLDAAPPALQAARPALDEGRQLLGAVRSLATSASRTLPVAPGGLRAATALLQEAPPPLRRAEDLLDAAQPAVPAAISVVRALDPVTPLLTRGADDLAGIARVLGPYRCDIVDFGDNWRSVLNQGGTGGSEIGPLTAFRVNVIAGPETLVGLGADAPNSVESYPPPCKYSSPPPLYEKVDSVGGSSGGLLSTRATKGSR